MFSIIIPTKNRKEILKESLKNLEKIKNLVPFEVIVINDSEGDDYNDVISEFAFIKLFDNIRNGVASARNFGVTKAIFDVIIFIDDDIIVTEKALKSSIDFIDNYKNACLNVNWIYPNILHNQCKEKKFGRYILKHGFDSLKGWRKNDVWDDNNIFKVPFGASYFLVIHKKIFEKVGGYNEIFPYSGFEDHEFNIRLNKNKIDIYIDPLNFVYHNEVDKSNLLIWLDRKYKTYKTIKIGYRLGYLEADIKISLFKKGIYFLISPFRKIFYGIYYIIPNNKKFDFFSHKLIDVMHGISSFRGFYLSK
jgi:glycosyltransferase involved in cell wall biosynthesis